ncbi:hypothetical protein I79_025370 [Cricetulus griseus]|uniref:Uncharacterized protein n=1 Tax=Cricetulus griseus TaxID=10029 RepID=G3IN58_CRIGR|nr:hypothetical protein I79_025370 [Cricetulus griseus]
MLHSANHLSSGIRSGSGRAHSSLLQQDRCSSGPLPLTLESWVVGGGDPALRGPLAGAILNHVFLLPVFALLDSDSRFPGFLLPPGWSCCRSADQLPTREFAPQTRSVRRALSEATFPGSGQPSRQKQNSR